MDVAVKLFVEVPRVVEVRPRKNDAPVFQQDPCTPARDLRKRSNLLDRQPSFLQELSLSSPTGRYFTGALDLDTEAAAR